MRFLGFRGGEDLDLHFLPSLPVHFDGWPILVLSVSRYNPLHANRTKGQYYFAYNLKKKISFYKSTLWQPTKW